MTAFKLHDLPVSNITPEAAGAVAITLQVPDALRSGFNFKAGQFLTLRATIAWNVFEWLLWLWSPPIQNRHF